MPRVSEEATPRQDQGLSRLVDARTGVLAVMDGYRVTGPGRQLLAVAAPCPSSRFVTTLALFQRSTGPTPLISTALLSNVPVQVIPDRFPGDPRSIVALAALGRRPDVHVVQTHGYKANVLGLLAARMIRRPWIAFLHGETWENLKVRTYFALERLVVRRADRIVVVSHDMARKVIDGGILAAKVQVVHNASLLAPQSDPPAWRSDAAARVGVIGRLSPEKGVDIALRVHDRVVRRVGDAQLLVAGEGPERIALAQLADQLGIVSSVHWLGYKDSLADVYRQLAVLLLPSWSEGLPNVALEAMAHGIPVVASSAGGIPEVVSHGENGFLAPPGDAEALAGRVVELLQNPSLRKRLGLRGRELASSRFSLAARIRALADIYERVTA